MIPQSPPKGGTKRDFAVFASKILVLSKKSAAKFLCMKTSSGTVVATLFLYLTVHRWIAGDVPVYLKFALKVTHPFRKRRFRLIVPQPWELVRNVKLSLIGSRAIDECCALPLSPPKGWLKTRIFTFGIAFHFFIAGHRRHCKFNMWVEHSNSQPTDDKFSLKGAWSLSCDLWLWENEW